MNGIFRRFFYSFIFLIFATKNVLQCLVNQTKSIFKDHCWSIVDCLDKIYIYQFLCDLFNIPLKLSTTCICQSPSRVRTQFAHLWTIVWSNGSPLNVKMFLCILQIKHKPLLTSTPHTPTCSTLPAPSYWALMYRLLFWMFDPSYVTTLQI